MNGSEGGGAVVSSGGEQFAQVGPIKLCYETFGSQSAVPVLLVMGLATQMILWDDEFCETLADHGHWVIRFDNRDVGRSTILRDAPIPTTRQLLLRQKRGASYSLDDLASDAAGLLDELGLESAHVVGVSMGGMIAQLLALNHRQRVRSLVSIMSSTGSRRVGQPSPRMYPRLLRRARTDRAGYIEDFLETYRVISGRRYPPDPVRMRATAERCFDRGVHPAGAARQLAAIGTAPDRTPRLRRLTLPATVVHGDADPLVLRSGGRATAAAIPGAKLVIVPGMGHSLPPALWPLVISEIEETVARASELVHR
jgi:pimeloyl-ACP methyl ester carboxylesterase